MLKLDLESRDPYRCFYCNVKYDKKVEAGGIYYCPNPCCSGPGAAWFRAKMDSYREVEGGRHSVEWEEILTKGRAYLESQPLLWAAVWNHCTPQHGGHNGAVE